MYIGPSESARTLHYGMDTSYIILHTDKTSILVIIWSLPTSSVLQSLRRASYRAYIKRLVEPDVEHLAEPPCIEPPYVELPYIELPYIEPRAELRAERAPRRAS